MEYRKTLRKQLSEEICEAKGAKILGKPHIKIAWADTGVFDSQNEEGVVVKKCIKELKKPARVTRHNSLEKESILYSKEELADRLRQVLKERDQIRPNLNIFLTHNTIADEDSGEKEQVSRDQPKIIPPLFVPMENRLKNSFQIRKNKESASTSTKLNAQNSIRIEDKLSPRGVHDLPTSQYRDGYMDKTDSKAIKNVIIRPATAVTKREMFQRQSNAAFNSIIKETKPPLVRSSSAPCKKSAEHSKPKFINNKRKAKSRVIKSLRCEDSEEDGGNSQENPKDKKEINRLIAVSGSDIVTMVSLVSPTTSDIEELDIEVKPKPKPSFLSKPNTKEGIESAKNLSLRKTAKTVSFQSSSIHAIRSFSASFPVRRVSMVTALMLGNGVKLQKNQEKRFTSTSAEEERGSKRRLKNSPDRNSTKVESDATNNELPESDTTVNITPKIPGSSLNVTAELVTEEIRDNGKKIVPDDGGVKFGSEKEKECYYMYRKMEERGLKVSYDTILRGMLTPTEYRMRRKDNTLLVNLVDDPTQQ